MRKYFFIFLLMANLSSYSQDDSLEIKFAPTITEQGKPAGEKVAKEIDQGGGKIISSDGRMELLIPTDAVQNVTNISILPVINTLSPGGTDGYQLEPAGINFQKPLQLVFHYSPEEDIVMPELRSIAWQDDKGQWYNLANAVVDTISRTVTGSITHFSTWVFFDYFNLKPVTGRVHVKNQLRLEIVCTYPGGLSDNFKAQLMKKMKFAAYVNGVRGGNAVAGTITAVKGSNEDRFTDYTAPASVPDNNPVAVSVEVSNVNFNGRNYSKLKLISNISVFDAYRITVIGYNKQHVLSCVVSSIDSSSCVLQLGGKQSKLVDIQNMNIQVTSGGCRCEVTEINKGNNVGPINIAGITKVDVVPAHPPEKPYAFITVYFTRTFGVMPGWHAPPCGHTNDVVTPPMPLPAVPFVIPFEARDEEYTVMKQGGDNGFEIKVRPVDK